MDTRNEINNLESEDSSDKHSLTYKFIEKLKESALSLDETDNQIDFETQNNVYYLPEFGNNLSVLCREFPCWTNVMNEHFENPHHVATSAHSEGFFAAFKRDSLDNRVPERTDKLLVNTIRIIDKDMLLAWAAISDIINAKSTLSNKCSKKDKKDHLLVAERWKNKFTILEDEEFSDSEIDAGDNIDD